MYLERLYKRFFIFLSFFISIFILVLGFLVVKNVCVEM